MRWPHWEYYLAIEDNLARCARFIEPSPGNMGTYSIELAQIMLLACSEIDVVQKMICQHLSPGISKIKIDNINKRHLVITNNLVTYTQLKCRIPRFNFGPCIPWKAWLPTQYPEWWAAYNGIKHSRNENYCKASLHNAILSVMGLQVTLLSYYNLCCNNVDFVENPLVPNLVMPEGYAPSSPGGIILAFVFPSTSE
ncbi:MAG: hypothetical protein ACOZHQ_18095 [Thermodesulfobacteriota bacterium]